MIMEKENLKQFTNDLLQYDIVLNELQLNQFIKYYKLLVKWNSVMNLTSIIDFDDVLKKHFVDSLSLVVTGINMNEQLKLIDVGTGAGFPGIPLKIAFPELRVTLLDSLNKRVQFLNEVIGELELDFINAIHGRAEDAARIKEERGGYDICVSRAVANLSVLSEYTIPFLKIGGHFIAYKSDSNEEEKMMSQLAVKELGAEFENSFHFTLPYSDINRSLYVIRKDFETDCKYPRKAGVPIKKPL